MTAVLQRWAIPCTLRSETLIGYKHAQVRPSGRWAFVVSGR